MADAAERKTLGSGYRLTGNTVVEVADAGACLELLEKQPPDALVVDPRLPGLEASQLLPQRHERPGRTYPGPRQLDPEHYGE